MPQTIHSPEPLTKNQTLVMGALSEAAGPLSAYTILDQLRDHGFRAPQQVYRALEIGQGAFRLALQIRLDAEKIEAPRVQGLRVGHHFLDQSPEGRELRQLRRPGGEVHIDQDVALVLCREDRGCTCQAASTMPLLPPSPLLQGMTSLKPYSHPDHGYGATHAFVRK